MTFQPPPPPPPPASPPPPPGGPQGGPPQGAWGPPPGAGQPMRAGFDPKSVNQLDWGIMGAGLLAFIFSFVSYYSFSAKNCGDLCDNYNLTESAWNGFFGWFAMLLAVVGSALVALELFMPQVKLPFPNRLIGLGCYAVATLCVILALFVVPDYLGGGPGYDKYVDEGHGFGYWISLIVIIAGLVLSLMRFQQGGGKLPGALGGIPNIGGHAPGAHGAGGPAGQPPAGPPPYGAPPQGPPQGPPQYGAPPQGPPPQGPPR